MRPILFLSLFLLGCPIIGFSQISLNDAQTPDSLLNIGGKTAIHIKDNSINRRIKEPENYLFYYNLDEMVTVSSIIGNSFSGWSTTYFVHGLYARDRIAIPLTFSIDFVEKFTTKKAARYQTTSTYYSKVGAEAFYALKKRLWLNLGIQVPIGNEKLADWDGNSYSTFVLGIYLSESIRFMSAKYEGFSIGIGLFQQYISSKVIPENYGFKVEVGYKF